MIRFITQDTYEGDISNPLSLNLYTYVENNPLIYTDPSGYCISEKMCEYINSLKSAFVNKVGATQEFVKNASLDSLEFAMNAAHNLNAFAPGEGTLVANALKAARLALIARLSKYETATIPTVLNVGAGENPILGAINIDIRAGKGIDLIADANKLPYATSSIDGVIMQSPYYYSPMLSDAGRVLKNDGTLTIVGNTSNKYFVEVWDMSVETLKNYGYELIQKGEAQAALKTSYTSNGTPIPESPLKEIVLKRVIKQ